MHRYFEINESGHNIRGKIYYQNLKELEEKGKIELPTVPKECVHNAHMFYIKARNLEERQVILSHLKGHGIGAVFHYLSRRNQMSITPPK